MTRWTVLKATNGTIKLSIWEVKASTTAFTIELMHKATRDTVVYGRYPGKEKSYSEQNKL